MRLSMRAAAALMLAIALAGCGRLAPAVPAAEAGLAASAKRDAALAKLLKRFGAEEGRRVSARHVPMNQGRGAAELTVRLSAEEQALLVQLYRLHPRPIPAGDFPAGLLERASEHLAALHRFKLPSAERLDPARLRAALKTRRYTDGEGGTLAFESFYTGETFMMFGKYDTAGRILKIDIETWE